MVVGISKRQQFRNERALQDLIRSVPGNDRCADCHAMNPGWASWNLGIFLCMRCAALHRKMGTHISKVKSLSMDSWSSEQVDNMKSHGNNIMNKIYNPKNVKPPVPTDIDEADSCMERFIRQKYQYRSLEDGKPKPPTRDLPERVDISPEGSPPPLPPKPGKPFGFGLRSASSATNLHRLSNKGELSPRPQSPPPPMPTRSTSQGLDASNGTMSSASFESMMNTLKDMGFQNERRNAAVLRGLDGNLDKSIETLVRLGEGSGPVSRTRTPAQASTTTSSSNPFDQLDSKPPAPQPAGQSYNPFDIPAAQPASAQPLEQSFQGLQVSQPLFPHSTGGYPNQPMAQHQPQPLYQPSATPPVTSAFSQGTFVQSPQPVDRNPFFQAQPSMAVPTQSPGLTPANNPFFTQAPTPSTSMQPPNQTSMTSIPVPNPPRHANTMPALSSTSPFAQPSPFQQQTSPFQQRQQQQPLQPQVPQQLQGPVSHNPFQSMTAPTTPQTLGYHQQLQPQYGSQAPSAPAAQYLGPQPTGRVDKNSILSLYSFSPPQASPAPFNPTPQTQLQQPQHLQQPVATTGAPNLQAASSRNPFFTAPPAGVAAPPQQTLAPSQPFAVDMSMNSAPPSSNAFPRGHMSQQSVDINGFQNGRHSPDAFASLSARYG